MNDMASIEQKLGGPPEALQRRVSLLAGLARAFAKGGPQAVTEHLDRRLAELENAFAKQLGELRKLF